jgi:hypothetical protein
MLLWVAVAALLSTACACTSDAASPVTCSVEITAPRARHVLLGPAAAFAFNVAVSTSPPHRHVAPSLAVASGCVLSVTHDSAGGVANMTSVGVSLAVQGDGDRLTASWAGSLSGLAEGWHTIGIALWAGVAAADGVRSCEALLNGQVTAPCESRRLCSVDMSVYTVFEGDAVTQGREHWWKNYVHPVGVPAVGPLDAQGERHQS